MSEKQISRRTFLRIVGLTAGAAAVNACVLGAIPQERPEREEKPAEEPQQEVKPSLEEDIEEEPPVVEEPAVEEQPDEAPPTDQASAEGNPMEKEEPDLGELAGRPFLMPVEDIFSIKGRGTVVTGQVRRGTVEVGNQVEIVGGGSRVLTTVVTDIEQFQKTIEAAFPGENVGLLLRGINREDLQRGQVVAEPGSIAAYEVFNAEIDLLMKEEGGGKVVFNGYRPQIHIWTNDVTGEITLQEDIEMIQPGQSGAVRIELIEPIALEVGTEFAFREGGRTIGTGVVTELLN